MQTTPSFLRPSMPTSSSQLRLTLLLLALALLFSPSQPAACTSQHFSNNKTYTFCADLPALNAFLHWTYDSARPTLSIAFVAPPAQPDGWVAWAINPTASGMKGSQALIAFKDANGVMAVKTYNVSSYGPLTAASEVTWFEVQESVAEFSDGVVRIFATLVLPEKGMTVVNHVWQVGSAVNVSVPEKHGFQPDNMNSKGSLDLLKGNSDGGGGDSRTKNRNIHGLLNVMSWGIMLPIGVLVSRYIRAFPSANPAWFYLHISCQFSGYAVGVAGWATGLKLGSESKGITHSYHRNIGITLFALATLQILVSFLRPKKDHKYRLYWNIYHHGAGYAIIALSIINVFKGFEILKPQQKWRTAYIVVIAVLGGIAVLLEAITWIMFGWRKKFTKP